MDDGRMLYRRSYRIQILRDHDRRHKHGGFKSMGDRMKEANGLIGMVNYAAERSGSKYVIGREGWKTMIVNNLMYGCGALAWYQRECDDLEVMQSGF